MTPKFRNVRNKMKKKFKSRDKKRHQCINETDIDRCKDEQGDNLMNQKGDNSYKTKGDNTTKMKLIDCDMHKTDIQV